MELPKDVKVVMLSPKDVAIMKGMQTLHTMEEKLSPLLQVFDLMKVALESMVFEGKRDGEYVIELDKDHKAVFTMKDGEFDYEMTCACNGMHEDEQHNSVNMTNV